MLTKNAESSARERLTLIRLFEELRSLGYEGGYDAVRRYAKTWSREHASQTASAYVPLSFAPGEAYQFDWSHEIVVMDGATTTLKVAHVRLCHSRMMFVRAYPRETQEMVFDAHERGFAFFKGACTRGIPDYVASHIIVVLCPPPLCGAPPRNWLPAATVGHITIRGRQAIRAALARFARQVFGEVPPKKSKAAGTLRALPVSS
jgi:transposase